MKIWLVADVLYKSLSVLDLAGNEINDNGAEKLAKGITSSMVTQK